MKLTKSQLKQIIKEELQKVLQERQRRPAETIGGTKEYPYVPDIEPTPEDYECTDVSDCYEIFPSVAGQCDEIVCLECRPPANRMPWPTHRPRGRCYDKVTKEYWDEDYETS